MKFAFCSAGILPALLPFRAISYRRHLAGVFFLPGGGTGRFRYALEWPVPPPGAIGF